MLRFTTCVTQKGQITLPKKLRDRFGIAAWSKVIVAADAAGIRIEPTQDIVSLAGTFVPKIPKPVMDARDAMENKYQRF